MTKPERTFEAAPVKVGSEVQLDLSELLFSCTDSNGVIQFANDAFCRATGLSNEEVVGIPHKAVRHPDMPKALFRMMWQTLEAGKYLGAYVKNQSRDGRFYWVFLTVAPIMDGYISVRIKPTSDLLRNMQGVYAQCLQLEQDGATIEESTAALLAGVRALGFDSYEAFQSVALAAEFSAREAALSKVTQVASTRLTAAADAVFSMRRLASSMSTELKAVRTVPMNMRILASRLENAGGPISAISVNYGAMLDEMSEWVKGFSQGDGNQLAQMSQSILGAQFAFILSALQDEICALQKADAVTAEWVFPSDQITKFRQGATQALTDAELESAKLARGIMDMKRHVTGLSSTRMLCKIESASLDTGGQALDGIIDQLDASQKTIEDQLGRIADLNALIQSNAVQLNSGRA